jgi:hypothetical protein
MRRIGGRNWTTDYTDGTDRSDLGFICAIREIRRQLLELSLRIYLSAA